MPFQCLPTLLRIATPYGAESYRTSDYWAVRAGSRARDNSNKAVLSQEGVQSGGSEFCLQQATVTLQRPNELVDDCRSLRRDLCGAEPLKIAAYGLLKRYAQLLASSILTRSQNSPQQFSRRSGA